MTYKWVENVVIQNHDNKNLYINPNKGTWLKANKKVRNILDSLIFDDSNINLNDRRVKYILKTFKDANIVEEINASKSKTLIIEDNVTSLYFILTRKCNLACSFCSIESSPNVNEEKILTLSEIMLIIDSISEYNIRNINLTGGEPFLRNDLFEIITYINKKIKCNVSISTNGLLITREFLEHIKGIVTKLEISLENIFEEPSELLAIEKIIPIIEECGIRKGFSFVLTKKNWKNVFDFIDFAEKHNAEISIKPIAPIGRAAKRNDLMLSNKEYAIIFKRILQYIYDRKIDNENIRSYILKPMLPKCACGAKDHILCIYPNGSVYPCHSLNYPEFYLGNINNGGLDQVMFAKKNKQALNENSMLFNVDERENCKNCKVRYFCQGGCIGQELHNQNTVIKEINDCSVKRGLIKFSLWVYNRDNSFLDNINKLINMWEEVTSFEY